MRPLLRPMNDAMLHVTSRSTQLKSQNRQKYPVQFSMIPAQPDLTPSVRSVATSWREGNTHWPLEQKPLVHSAV